MSIHEAARAMADFRKANAPDGDVPGWRKVACPGCGHIYAYRSGKKKPDCPDCAAARLVSVAEQLRAKSGPAYARHVTSQLAYWSAEAERLRGGDA